MSRGPMAEGRVRRAFLAPAALALAGLLAALWSAPAHAAAFTVNSTGDAPDANLANAACDSNAAAAGSQCTLRAAIGEANDTAGADEIRFNIVSNANVKTIAPASPLPKITDAVTIDGYTQQGSGENTLAVGSDAVLKVQLNGTNAGAGADGLVIEAADSVVKGLVINRFGGSGIEIQGPGARGNSVGGNFLGTNAAGTVDLGNGFGVGLLSPDNTVGGSLPDARNLISGNGFDGVNVFGFFGAASGNEIVGNYIGTNADGTADLGNSRNGVQIDGADENVVGTTAGARNVISGNDDNGIQILDGATGNEVLGNSVGLSADGTERLGNSGNGVEISDAGTNTVGGTVSAARNVISGNTANGVVISGVNSSNNDILGNRIGTNLAGTVDLGNVGNGVEITQGDGNTVGGTANGSRNVISGNNENGVLMSNLGDSGNAVQGNFIGTDATGNDDLGNSGNGVEISQASDNTVGGTATAARNVISGNLGDGVVIFGDESRLNEVQGNFIGTGANGTTPLGNDGGVVISSGNDSTIGSDIGSTAGGNRIAHNTDEGVVVFGGLAVGNSVLSNSIFSNGRLGINLGGGTEDPFGVTANDTDDPDAPTSNNHRQNFPVITSAIRSNSTNLTTIAGTLNSNPSQTFTIQCFVAAPDPSGHGEGRVLVSQTTRTTNANGDVGFSCVSPIPLPNQAVTATATNTTGTTSGTSVGDTSEFSRILGVVAGP